MPSFIKGMKWNYWRAESNFRSSGLHRICRRHSLSFVNLPIVVTKMSNSAMEPSHTPIQWVPEGPGIGSKAAEVW